jgi:hypothetical protein
MAGLFAIVAAYLSYREVACNDNHDAVKDWFKEKWILLNNSGWLSMPEKIIGLVLYLKNDAAETLSDFVSGRAQAKVIFILYFIALSSASIYHSGIFVAVIVILSCLPFMYFGYNYKLDELLELRPKYIGHFYGFLISIYSFYLWTVLFVETEIFLSAAISSLLLPVFWFSIFTPIAIAIHARNPDSNIDEDTLIIVGFSFAVSFCITLIAILIGKVSYPSAPLPQTIQMLLINTLFDGVTMLATIYILQWSIKDDKRDRELRSRSRLSPRLRYAPMAKTGSAHAPPIKAIGADCASQFEIGAFAPSQTCDARGSTAALARWCAARIHDRRLGKSRE